MLILCNLNIGIMQSESPRDVRAMGSHASRARARHEFAPTGETSRKRNVESYDELTPQKPHCAVAVEGSPAAKNMEIGAQLSISARTSSGTCTTSTPSSVSRPRELREAVPRQRGRRHGVRAVRSRPGSNRVLTVRNLWRASRHFTAERVGVRWGENSLLSWSSSKSGPEAIPTRR